MDYKTEYLSATKIIYILDIKKNYFYYIIPY